MPCRATNEPLAWSKILLGLVIWIGGLGSAVVSLVREHRAESSEQSWKATTKVVEMTYAAWRSQFLWWMGFGLITSLVVLPTLVFYQNITSYSTPIQMKTDLEILVVWLATLAVGGAVHFLVTLVVPALARGIMRGRLQKLEDC